MNQLALAIHNIHSCSGKTVDLSNQEKDLIAQIESLLKLPKEELIALLTEIPLTDWPMIQNNTE